MSGRTDQAWSSEEIEILCTLWKEGVNIRDIARKLRRNRSGVAQYAYRNRVKLGLEKRGPSRVKKRSQPKSFEEQWNGSVPFGHWSITKPWRSSCSKSQR